MPKCAPGEKPTAEVPCEPLPLCEVGIFEVPQDNSCEPIPICAVKDMSIDHNC